MRFCRGGFVSGAGYPIYRSNFPHSNALIRLSEDGMAASLHIAAAEIGQGCNTILPQIAAEELARKKIEGEEIVSPESPEPTKVLDLLEALKASVEATKERKAAS